MVTLLSSWLNGHAWPMAILLGVILIPWLVLKLSATRREKSLMQLRDGITADGFAEYLAGFGYDPLLAKATYRYLQEVHKVTFPILPSDDLREDLGLGGKDVEQSIRDLAAALRRECTPLLLRKPVVTVEDLVGLLQSLRLASMARVA